MKDLVLRISWWLLQQITGEVRSDRGQVGNLRDRIPLWRKVLRFIFFLACVTITIIVIRAIVLWFIGLGFNAKYEFFRGLLVLIGMLVIYMAGYIHGRKRK